MLLDLSLLCDVRHNIFITFKYMFSLFCASIIHVGACIICNLFRAVATLRHEEAAASSLYDR